MELIQPKIDRFLRTQEGSFEDLALELFAYQFEKNLPYQAFCRSQELRPETVRTWQDIPAVPIGAFKSVEFSTFPVGRAAAIFESSGTTRATPSRHFLKTLHYYETALKKSFEQHVLQSACPIFVLAPSPAEAPRSSLSWMMDVVKRAWGSAGSEYFVQRARLDEPRLARALKKAEAAREPVALLGTTIAFLAFFDYAVRTGQTFALAAGSRVMDTGGMKSQRREMSRPEFVQLVQSLLGIPEAQAINEYGMCEMSSQFYGRGASVVLQGPPWVRTLVIDPQTGERLPSGQEGLLRHFDLANVDSVMAIQTDDIGLASPEPSQKFILRGRSPGAEVKGCSLAAEAFLR